MHKAFTYFKSYYRAYLIYYAQRLRREITAELSHSGDWLTSDDIAVKRKRLVAVEGRLSRG